MKPLSNKSLSYKFLVKPLKLRQTNVDNGKFWYIFEIVE